MKIQFKWQKPVDLTHNRIILQVDYSKIKPVAGVYYFARTFGGKGLPFYIGQSTNLNERLKSHLRTVRIADILRGMPVAGAPAIDRGPRSFHFAYLTAVSNNQTGLALKIVEKMMIEEAVRERIPLLNTQLTLRRTHEISFGRGRGGKECFEDDWEMEE